MRLRDLCPLYLGLKIAAAIEPERELILDIIELAFRGDGEHLLPTVQHVEESTGGTIESVIGDGAYPIDASLAHAAKLASASIERVARLTTATDPVVDMSPFKIDLTALPFILDVAPAL